MIGRLFNQRIFVVFLLAFAGNVQVTDASLGTVWPPPVSLAAKRQPRRSAIGRFSVPYSNRPSDTTNDNHGDTSDALNRGMICMPPRGGKISQGGLVKLLTAVTELLIRCGQLVLPPTVAVIRTLFGLYRALPTDAILAQVGLVYCFAGGYYPTLFSTLQAARQCGLEIMLHALGDLTNEALKAIDATTTPSSASPSYGPWTETVLDKTSIVLKTVDPVKINQAAAALYTTWLGVSAVLEKEYAKVISLSLTMAGLFERAAQFLIEPPARMCVSEDYHAWVPVVIGWGCKAAAMNIAWRIQRLMTASTSAMAGGLMFSRACLRMLSKRNVLRFENHENSGLDEVIGFLVAGIGFYTQVEAQYKSGFSFTVPYPFKLVTWPMDCAERWIQWQITKE